MDFAGRSSAVLKKVHLQRLMAVAVALIACTFVAWELMIVCWAITPYTPVRGSGILGDFLSVLVRLLPPCFCSYATTPFFAAREKQMQLTFENQLSTF